MHAINGPVRQCYQNRVLGGQSSFPTWLFLTCARVGLWFSLQRLALTMNKLTRFAVSAALVSILNACVPGGGKMAMQICTGAGDVPKTPMLTDCTFSN